MRSGVRSVLLIISGPAGSGKTTICERLGREFPQVRRLVTTTSRRPRPGEVDGRDYHFLSPEAFEEKIGAGEFLEWARVHGRYYGSQRRHVLALLDSGNDILLNIDVQGARAFRKLGNADPHLKGRVHSVFILPESEDQLRQRLQRRGADDQAEIERRLKSAIEELADANHFDHRIVSGTRDADYAAVRQLLLDLKNAS